MNEIHQRLDILVFGIRGIPSSYGGFETFCTTFLPALSDRGHSVELITRDRTFDATSYGGVTLSHLPALPMKQVETLSHALACSLWSRKRRPDVILAFNVANGPLIRAFTPRSIPVVLNVDGQEWLRESWGPIGRRVFRFCAESAATSKFKLITDGEAMRSVYLDEFGADSTAIPYHFDASLDLPESESIEIVEKLGYVPGKYFVTGGRFVAENNIVPIVDSYRTYAGPEPMVVLGRSKYGSPIQAELEELRETDERIILQGHVHDRRTFVALLRHAAVYFHGHSVGGTNPMLVEALGSGALVGALATPFNTETLGDAGLFFQDPLRAVPSVLEQLDRHTDSRLRSRALERAGSEFAGSRIVDLYEAAIRDAVDAGEQR